MPDTITHPDSQGCFCPEPDCGLTITEGSDRCWRHTPNWSHDWARTNTAAERTNT